jgi:hypothetical protein
MSPDTLGLFKDPQKICVDSSGRLAYADRETGSATPQAIVS